MRGKVSGCAGSVISIPWTLVALTVPQTAWPQLIVMPEPSYHTTKLHPGPAETSSVKDSSGSPMTKVSGESVTPEPLLALSPCLAQSPLPSRG